MRIHFPPDGAQSRSDLLQHLKQQMRAVRGLPEKQGQVQFSEHAENESSSTGSENWTCPRLAPGALIEFIGGIGGGAGVLSLALARQFAQTQRGEIVVIDRQRSFSPVAAAAWGLDLNHTVIVRPHTPQEELWAYDQCLRSEAVAVVWGFIDRLSSRHFRRLQLSAEAGRGVGLLIRPLSAAKQPTWADVRLAIEPRPSVGRSPRYDMRVLHCRGGYLHAEAILTIDETTGLIQKVASHETHHVPLAAELADSTARYGHTGT